MSGHYVRTKAAMLGHLGNMHGKCPMSDRYFKLCIHTYLHTYIAKYSGLIDVGLIQARPNYDIVLN